MSKLTVKMGEYAVSRNPEVLETCGVGSCLAIVLYDPETRIGGLAHAMLPRLQNDNTIPLPFSTRYVECAIDALLEQLAAAGAMKSRLIAKLVGGSHMFSLYGDQEHSIGNRNVLEAKQKLQRENIPISSEETGGTVGRNIVFDTSNGVCSVETKM